MTLWLLRPIDDAPNTKNPWNPDYDTCHGMVIRAESEAVAREIAAYGTADGGWHYHGDEGAEPWTNPTLTTCTELIGDGPIEVVICDNHWA
jgi:hypothetical protein